MTSQDSEFNLELSRRKSPCRRGHWQRRPVGAAYHRNYRSRAAPELSRAPDPVQTPPVAGLASAVRRRCIVGDGGVMAHAATRSPCPSRARALDGKLEQTAEARRRRYTDAKSGQVVHAYHAKLDRLQADTAYLYGALHEGAAPEFGTFRTAPRGRSPLTFTSFGDQGTPTLGKRYVPPAGVTIPNPPYRERQPRLAGGRRYDAWRRAAAAPVPSAQWRSVLRQSRGRSGAHLVGFLGEQQPQRPQPSLDAIGRQPRERARQRPDRLSRLSDLLLAAAGDRPDRSDARALVCLHRRLGAGDQHRQRRRCLPGRRQFLRTGIFEGRAKGLAGKGAGCCPRRYEISIGSSCACTRSRFRRPTSSMARTLASARSGFRCSTNTASISWCADTSTTTSARTRSAAGSQRHLDARSCSDRHRCDRHQPRERCTW